jgi:hypothetical protein
MSPAAMTPRSGMPEPISTPTVIPVYTIPAPVH